MGSGGGTVPPKPEGITAALDAAIEKLTTAEVNAAFRKYVKAPEFAYAFAGDFAKAAPK